MKLIDVYMADGPRTSAIDFLYQLMKERPPESNISHQEMPTIEQHVAYVNSKLLRFWELIEDDEGNWIGYVCATYRNEIGVVLKQDAGGMGYGEQAVRLAMEKYRPLPALAGECCGKWLANINPDNNASIYLFEDKLGGKLIQLTYILSGD